MTFRLIVLLWLVLSPLVALLAGAVCAGGHAEDVHLGYSD